MELVLSSQTGVVIHQTIFEFILGLLMISPIFLLGIVLIGILLFLIFKKDRMIPRIKTSVLSLILYYYLCMMLVNIVGIPTLNEFIRLSQLGEPFFNPNINLIPFSDELSFSFIANIFLFIPLGFLCPLISSTYAQVKNVFFIGLGLSLFIEIVQLFTLYRATDINDLLTNVIGALIGYCCFRFVQKIRGRKPHSPSRSVKKDYTAYLPVIIMIIAFGVGFFS